jgi:hypothetical protein
MRFSSACWVVCLGAQEHQPLAARQIEAKRDAAISQARKAYQQAVIAAERQCAADYQAAAANAMKVGNAELVAALAAGKKEAEKRVEEASGRLSAQTCRELVVKAFIDGNAHLYVSDRGIYWKQGDASKPGMHGGSKEPTIINGNRWFPNWGGHAERGPDTSDFYKLTLSSLEALQLEVVAVSIRFDGSGVERRDAVTLKKIGDEHVVSIPDSQSGARWYTLKLTPVLQ